MNKEQRAQYKAISLDIRLALDLSKRIGSISIRDYVLERCELLADGLMCIDTAIIYNDDDGETIQAAMDNLQREVNYIVGVSIHNAKDGKES